MNIRKLADYTTMFAALDALTAAQLPQMELYCEIGRVVSGRSEKGAAVAASEYLQDTYPATEGFSPRNLRRMRAFYAAYEKTPEIMRLAMRLGWTQNVAILERCGNNEERAWYIRAALRFGWKKRNYWNRSKRRHGEILLSTSKRFPAILVKKKQRRRARAMKKILFVCHGIIYRNL